MLLGADISLAPIAVTRIARSVLLVNQLKGQLRPNYAIAREADLNHEMNRLGFDATASVVFRYFRFFSLVQTFRKAKSGDVLASSIQRFE